MDLRFTKEEEAFRQEVRAFVQAYHSKNASGKKRQ